MGLCFERLTLMFAFGLFFSLPLYFKSKGWDEAFFGQVFAAGALGTMIFVALGSAMIRKMGLSRVAPLGSLLYTLGCLFYFLCDVTDNVTGYYLASFFQGAGWGMSFTIGSICVSTTTDNDDRSYYFTIYAAYTTLGFGLSPLVTRYFVEHLYWAYQDVFILGALFSGVATLISARVAYHNTPYQNVKIARLSGWSECVEVMHQPSVYFFIMVVFGTCIHTTMINLQTTFALAQGIDYTVFYTCYALATVSARFLLSRPMSKMLPKTSLLMLLSFLIIAIVLMLLAKNSLLIYMLSALAMGVSYGLAYPLIQAQSVHYAAVHLQPSILIYFSLSYFFAAYTFPYIGALIATRYNYSVLLWVLIVTAVVETLVAIYFYQVVAKNIAKKASMA